MQRVHELARGRRAFFAAAACFIIVSAAGGCSKYGKVIGTITFEGKPVPAGRIEFKGPNGTKGVDFEDGKYELPEASLGACKISVDTISAKASEMGGGAELPPAQLDKMNAEQKANYQKQIDAQKAAQGKAKKFMEIPDKYSDFDKSGLSFTVEKGTHEYPVVLVRGDWKEKFGPDGRPLPGAGGMPHP